tara:strand:- start:930 stop:1244 length:315 start_codon:yes stop_codon:yes gene_type:complete
MITALVVTIVILLGLLGVSLFYLIRFVGALLAFEDAVSNALRTLDESYNRISDILETPVFFNSPEVQRVITEIDRVRETFLGIANNFTGDEVASGTVLPEELDG